jgi:hypothetical protein
MTEFVNNMPDCLVFKFEEVEKDTERIDTTVYVLFDQMKEKYIVRGQRRWNPRYQSCTYSFDCDHICDLVEFLQYVVCPSNRVNEVLYNYDNLPDDSNKITYEFLHDYDHSDYEISGYNDRKFSSKRLFKNLRMLRKIGNKF